MTAAQLSLLALIAALVLSMTTRINVGWLALAFAWLIGVYRGGMRPDAVMAGFPASLFITLTGVTLLFAIADANLTLSAVASRIIRAARGSPRVIPVVLFAIACAMSSVGPGAISTVALLAPLAMTMGDRARVPALLTALMVANGANAGNLSPFSSVGVIANSAMAKAGITGQEGRVWFANFAAHVVVAAVAYLWLSRRSAATAPGDAAPASDEAMAPLTRKQRLTLIVVGGWIAGVLLFQFSLGLSAFAAAAVLILIRAADEASAIRRMPWNVIMMVCGVSVLIAVLEKTGGMELFTSLLARAASPGTINGVIAFVTGAISTYSSTSGVVLPAFLPTVPGIVQQLGGGDPLEVALSINVGSSLVDVSPLSTLGALCVAAVPGHVDANALFRALLIWGVSMTVVGAVWCQLFAGWMAG
jgi:Na+/H+ antiporter NhaD/arsenite permease-like protein